MKKNDMQRFEESLLSLLCDNMPKKLALGVSGGADSMFLSMLASDFCKKYQIELHYLIVDHRLREESLYEAQITKKRIEEYFSTEKAKILTWEHSEKIKGNISQEARKSRYALMTEWCKEKGIKHLCIAHTKNDQAETILQRLFHGSSCSGLAGIHSASSFNGIRVLRPIMPWQRKDVEIALQERNIDWVNDPSNQNLKYDRVKVRKIIDYIAEVGIVESKSLLLDRICDSGQNLSRANEFIQSQTEEYKDVCQKVYEDLEGRKVIVLNISALFKKHEEIVLRIIKESMSAISNVKRIRMSAIGNLLRALKNDSFLRTTCASCIIERVKNNSAFLIGIYPEKADSRKIYQDLIYSHSDAIN